MTQQPKSMKSQQHMNSHKQIDELTINNGELGNKHEFAARIDDMAIKTWLSYSKKHQRNSNANQWHINGNRRISNTNQWNGGDNDEITIKTVW